MSSISRLAANVAPPARGACCATLPSEGASARGASLGAGVEATVGLGIAAASATPGLPGMPGSGGGGGAATPGALAASGVASLKPAAPGPPQPVAKIATEVERAKPKPGNLWRMTR